MIKTYATVRDAVEVTGLSGETIRHYEKRGILPKAMRHPVNGYRVWLRDELLSACERLRPQFVSVNGAQPAH